MTGHDQPESPVTINRNDRSRSTGIPTRAAKVDDALVELLRQREQAMPTATMFHSGDSVVVTDGPFAGIGAIYQMADADRRALILLEILSKPVSMQIEPGRLRSAD